MPNSTCSYLDLDRTISPTNTNDSVVEITETYKMWGNVLQNASLLQIQEPVLLITDLTTSA